MATALPFSDCVFGLVCAMDIVEHVAEDELALSELARVSAPGAALLLSVPLHAAAWSGFDEMVGHHRRYEPARLLKLLATAGFTIEDSVRSGMLPRSRRLRDAGVWFLRHQHERAMWWYNHVFMPIGLRRAPRLALATGLINLDRVAGVLLLCRKV